MCVRLQNGYVWDSNHGFQHTHDTNVPVSTQASMLGERLRKVDGCVGVGVWVWGGFM
jgi:hypothetical protein